MRILSGADRLAISKELLGELLTVLARKFSRDREELSRVAFWISELAEWVTPTRRINAVVDEPDNRVLECAVVAKASVIVSGDKALLRLQLFEGVRIVLLRDYLSAAP
jgi:putative PIN family toxin of toxin-antitoxin system